jgi:hypothetical protein
MSFEFTRQGGSVFAAYLGIRTAVVLTMEIEHCLK